MRHLDEGALRALLDDELPEPEAAEARGHVGACATCDAALRRAEETQVLTTALLDALDGPAPVERVRARLVERRREGLRPARRTRSWAVRGDLAKAALLVLAFSGAVAAAVHPASPLRRLLEPESTAPESAAANRAVEPTTTLAAPPREVGVRVSIYGAAQVALTGAAAGTAVEITWVDERAAAVYAPEGTTFSTSEAAGRIDAALAAGLVRIELPQSATRASLTVNGRTWLEKTGDRIDYPGPPALVEGRRVRFEVPGVR